MKVTVSAGFFKAVPRKTFQSDILNLFGNAANRMSSLFSSIEFPLCVLFSKATDASPFGDDGNRTLLKHGRRGEYLN